MPDVCPMSFPGGEGGAPHPYGSVGLLHAGPDLKARWIWKEEIDPGWKTFGRGTSCAFSAGP